MLDAQRSTGLRFSSLRAQRARGLPQRTRGSEGPGYDMPTIMTRLLHLGMPVEDVIRCTTISPARAIGRPASLSLADSRTGSKSKRPGRCGKSWSSATIPRRNSVTMTEFHSVTTRHHSIGSPLAMQRS